MTRISTPEDFAALFAPFDRQGIDSAMACFAEDCVFGTLGGTEQRSFVAV